MKIAKPPICPPNEDCFKDISDDKLLTLVLGSEDSIHYYHGMGIDGVLHTDYSSSGLRNTLKEHLNRFPNPCGDNEVDGNCWDPIFVIKPHINPPVIRIWWMYWTNWRY